MEGCKNRKRWLVKWTELTGGLGHCWRPGSWPGTELCFSIVFNGGYMYDCKQSWVEEFVNSRQSDFGFHRGSHRKKGWACSQHQGQTAVWQYVLLVFSIASKHLTSILSYPSFVGSPATAPCMLAVKRTSWLSCPSTLMRASPRS